MRQFECGVPLSELCREHGMSTASFYKWRAKYSGMDASIISQMKSLEDKNRRLKRMFARICGSLNFVISIRYSSGISLKKFYVRIP
jgi:hypothetical protein